MAVTYERVCQVISLPPDRRKDFEVNNLLPWFRKKSELFKNLKTRLLFDLIKNLEFSSRAQDDIIIKQGEQGDCMYILLRGQVTIYINYTLKAESEEGSEAAPPVIDVSNIPKEELRQHLGTFVINLGPGATFGEVALMSEDCIRTASIIVNEPSDLIVIDRDLYTRSVKDVLKAEFEEKANFIATNKYFRNWTPRYRKQLTMALQKETFSYESMIARQGAPVEAIYYILRGEVKLTMDARLHHTQYNKLYQSGVRVGDDLELGRTSVFNGSYQAPILEDGDEGWSTSGRQDGSNARRLGARNGTKRLPPVDVCFLGVNEPIGDVEVLMNLNSYMQSAQCTQRTEVLVLELKHFDRLLAKRNKRTVEAMKRGLEERLMWRSHPQHCTARVPLLTHLLARAAAHNEEERARARARLSDMNSNHSVSESKTAEPFVPERGLLVDINGPGTVFHRIRQDYERHHPQGSQGSPARTSLLHQGRHSQSNHSYNKYEAEEDPESLGSNLITAKERRRKREIIRMGEEIDKETSDSALNDLEERLRVWLKSEGVRPQEKYDRFGLTSVHSGWTAPKVTKLHRLEFCEPEFLKPGSKILLRPKNFRNQPPPEFVRTETEAVEKDKHRSLSELGYYQMALNVSIPRTILPVNKRLTDNEEII